MKTKSIYSTNFTEIDRQLIYNNVSVAIAIAIDFLFSYFCTKIDIEEIELFHSKETYTLEMVFLTMCLIGLST